MTKSNTKSEKRKPTAKDWDIVRMMYLRNEELDYILASLPDVDLNKNCIVKKMSAEGVTAKRRAIQEKAIDSAASIAEKDKLQVNNMCIDLYNKGANIIQGLLGQYNKELLQGNISKGQARATAYNIDMLMSGVTKIQKGMRVAYGIDDNGKLYEKEPEVMIIEGFDQEKI
jgi:hypothetical protein